MHRIGVAEMMCCCPMTIDMRRNALRSLAPYGLWVTRVDAEIDDIVAFLYTLTDGYKPERN